MSADELEAALNKATRAPESTGGSVRFGRCAKHATFFLARDEARSLGHGYVGGEHILLGLLVEEQALAAHVLGVCGLSAERIRAQVSRRTGGESVGRLDYNLEARKVIEVAQAQMSGLGRGEVESGHVLLALLDQRDGVAVGVVRELGGEPERLRERVLAEMAAGHGDYESYTRAARELVIRAEQAARQLDEDQLDSGHLLLALLEDEQSIGAQVLRSRGITPGRALEAVTASMPGARGAPAGPIALSEHAKRALSLAEAEARSTGGRWVNPEHVLLGLAGDAQGVAARVLRELAGDPDELRNDIIRRLAVPGGDRESGLFGRLTQAAVQVVVLAQEEARVLKDEHIDSGHILLGLMREQDNAGAQALAALGITVDRVREQLAPPDSRAPRPTPALLSFDPSATEVFELAQRDARWLEHDHIDADHLMLAIVRGTETVAGRILDGVGADRHALRAQALIALDAPWASELSAAEEELSRREQRLRETQAWHRQATTDKERRERAGWVELSQRCVDAARAELLPRSCQDALEELVDYATEEWLKTQPPSDDEDHHRWYRRHCATNIHAQLINVLLHPALGPEANPIQGHPGGPDAPHHPQGPAPFSLGP